MRGVSRLLQEELLMAEVVMFKCVCRVPRRKRHPSIAVFKLGVGDHDAPPKEVNTIAILNL